jgi:hypothetical protein
MVFCETKPRIQQSGRQHVVKRAQGGSDFDLDRLGPPCHAQTDAPYARGRLVITPLGEGCFTNAGSIQAKFLCLLGPDVAEKPAFARCSPGAKCIRGRAPDLAVFGLGSPFP